jgi:predicted nucleic acid-binding protein
MKIYIDSCCYSRPFDNINHMIQLRVRAEAAAIINAVDICKAEGFSIIGSRMVTFEINKIPEAEKLHNAIRFYFKAITAKAAITRGVKIRAAELMTQGIKELDAYHVALSESTEVDYLLTTDDRLEAAAVRLGVKVKVINPINFLQEYVLWLQSRM